IGWQPILGYLLFYTLGLLIGQDIWQRVFTARSPGVARWGGFSAGVYCLAYAVAGALIGMAATKIVPGIEVQDDVFVAVVDAGVSPLLGGLVLAAALAAMMSTATGSLMAASTACRQDMVEPILARKDSPPETTTGRRRPDGSSDGGAKPTRVRSLVRETGGGGRESRISLIVRGVVTLVLAMIMPCVVEALTVAYNLLVAGLFSPILGGLI